MKTRQILALEMARRGWNNSHEQTLEQDLRDPERFAGAIQHLQEVVANQMSVSPAEAALLVQILDTVKKPLPRTRGTPGPADLTDAWGEEFQADFDYRVNAVAYARRLAKRDRVNGWGGIIGAAADRAQVSERTLWQWRKDYAEIVDFLEQREKPAEEYSADQIAHALCDLYEQMEAQRLEDLNWFEDLTESEAELIN